MVQQIVRWVRGGSGVDAGMAAEGVRSGAGSGLPLRCARCLAALAGAAALLAVGATPASATGATFQRAFQNLTQFPLDIVTSPITAGKSVVDNMQSVGDTTAVRVAYAVPGYFWNVMVDAGAGMIRGISGVIELVPGVVMLYSDKEMEPLFEPAEDNNALVEFDSSIYRLKFGIDYTTPAM